MCKAVEAVVCNALKDSQIAYKNLAKVYPYIKIHMYSTWNMLCTGDQLVVNDNVPWN